MRAARLLCVATLTACFASVAAEATTFAFATLPASGVSLGTAGETVGFGYVIGNPSATEWLVITSLDAGAFIDGTPDTAVFDFPVLAPGTSLSTAFDIGTSGLFAFTWDPAAPVGASNSGSFVLGAEWWSGDPAAGGSFLSVAAPVSAPYQLTSIPEPGAGLLGASVGACIALLRRRAPGRPAAPPR
jgi:hypothetical protein